jgi:hypothetical protein
LDLIANQEEKLALKRIGPHESPIYVDFIFVNYLNELGNWAMSFNMIILTLKLFKYFQVSPKLNVLLLTLRKAGSTLAYFFIIMFVTILGFSLAFYCAFNSLVEEYSTIGTSFMTLFFTLLGDGVGYRDLAQSNRILAPVFTWVYIFVVSILFFSLFITMIDESYGVVQEELAKRPVDKEHDMLFVKARLLRIKLRKQADKLSRRCCPCIGNCMDSFEEHRTHLEGGREPHRSRKSCLCMQCVNVFGCCCKVDRSKENAGNGAVQNIRRPSSNRVQACVSSLNVCCPRKSKDNWVTKWIEQRESDQRALQGRRCAMPRKKRYAQRQSTRFLERDITKTLLETKSEGMRRRVSVENMKLALVSPAASSSHSSSPSAVVGDSIERREGAFSDAIHELMKQLEEAEKRRESTVATKLGEITQLLMRAGLHDGDASGTGTPVVVSDKTVGQVNRSKTGRKFRPGKEKATSSPEISHVVETEENEDDNNNNDSSNKKVAAAFSETRAGLSSQSQSQSRGMKIRDDAPPNRHWNLSPTKQKGQPPEPQQQQLVSYCRANGEESTTAFSFEKGK